uniref:Uncharacterized protein n=1 Tax=Myoviridae sp. ctGrV43 TaxID=2825075 RepID=A0A8S5UF01_9CAUD|nr:MAG TPA: hypothetical protein [Myoviridae sp. ctGrV43]
MYLHFSTARSGFLALFCQIRAYSIFLKNHTLIFCFLF